VEQVGFKPRMRDRERRGVMDDERGDSAEELDVTEMGKEE